MAKTLGRKLYREFHRLGRKGARSINKLGRKFQMLHNSATEIFGKNPLIQQAIEGTPFIGTGVGALEKAGDALVGVGQIGKSLFKKKRKQMSIEK